MKTIKEKDIKKASNLERCKLLLELIKGEAIYIQDIKINEKEKPNEKDKEF